MPTHKLVERNRRSKKAGTGSSSSPSKNNTSRAKSVSLILAENKRKHKASSAASSSAKRKRTEDDASNVSASASVTPWKKEDIEKAASKTHSRNWAKDKLTENMNSGAFSKAEDEELLRIVSQVAKEKGIDDAEIIEGIITPANKNQKWTTSRRKAFWTAVAAHMPYRKVKSVMDRGVRLLHPGNGKGNFTAAEVQKLHKYVQSHGRRWKMIGSWLGRHPTAIRDRYQRDLQRGKVEGQATSKRALVTGRWSRKDTDKLVELIVKHNKDADYLERGVYPRRNIHWNKICGELNRTKESCSQKWTWELHDKMSGFSKTWSDAEILFMLKSIKKTEASSLDQVPWSKLGCPRMARVVRMYYTKLAKEIAGAKNIDIGFVATLDELLKRYQHASEFRCNPQKPESGSGKEQAVHTVSF